MIGVGYVGLVTGAGFAEFGNEVTCVDNDDTKIKKLMNGELPIYEPGLEELVVENVEAKRLVFTTDISSAIEKADVVFITVGTPPTADGDADLGSVYAVARRIGEVLKRTKQSKVVVVKSTVPVGTTEAVGNILASFIGESCVANNPEFLREGTAVEDFMRPDRVVIVTGSMTARDTLLKLYRPFTSAGKVLVMDTASSELVKYTSNAILAIRIAFMNEVAVLASAVGANVNFVRDGVGRDSRIGPKYLYPGPGYGGSCLPKDVSALVSMGEHSNAPMSIARAAQDSNYRHKRQIVERMAAYFKSLRGKKIAVWGLAFKAETDDIRDSPATAIVDALLENGADVHATDPQAATNARLQYGDRVFFHLNQYDTLRNADALVIATEWREYRSPDFDKILMLAPKLVVFDVRNLWDPADMLKSGIPYFGMGTTSFAATGPVSSNPNVRHT